MHFGLIRHRLPTVTAEFANSMRFTVVHIVSLLFELLIV
jgi:hypothetical protein